MKIIWRGIFVEGSYFALKALPIYIKTCGQSVRGDGPNRRCPAHHGGDAGIPDQSPEGRRCCGGVVPDMIKELCH